jgi:Na+/H+-translocating membrane pyrophosphatase
LYGAFLTRASRPRNSHPLKNVDVIEPLVFAGLLIGAMLPYAFSAMTMKAVGLAANEMVLEIRRQFAENPRIRTGEDKPDSERCI